MDVSTPRPATQTLDRRGKDSKGGKKGGKARRRPGKGGKTRGQGGAQRAWTGGRSSSPFDEVSCCTAMVVA